MRSGLPDSDMSAGQSSRATNGAGPVRILRPGDPGFPRSEDAPAESRRACQHPGCTTAFEPSARQRKYCTTHGTKQAEQERWRVKLQAVDVRQPAQNSAPRREEQGAGGGKASTGKTRRCFQCGKDYVPTGNAQRTCPDCKSKAIPPTKPKTLKDIQVRKVEADPRGTLAQPADPFREQIGGDHYKALAIQPIEYCQRNGLSYCEANVVKYVTRHRFKGGSQDILKAIHNLQLLLQMEYPQG